MYKALARASVTIERIDDMDQYEAIVVSTNGIILQPYDSSTTLIGTVLKNRVDVTTKISNIKWTKWNPTEDDLQPCPDWNKEHIGMSTIVVTKDDVDSKSIFVFEAYNKNNELLCSSSISIVDVNDLLASNIKPQNPYPGQLWIDDTTEPATMYMWNGYKWVVVGSIGAIVKNLLRNTSFSVNGKYWDIVGDTKLSYTPYSIDHLGHKFLKLNSEVLTTETRGISQTTTDIIAPNGEYSFQMLFYTVNDTQTYSDRIFVNIYSINKNNEETIIYEKVLDAEKDMKKLYANFNTLYDTEKIRVEITGEDGYRYDFYIAEPALYNTWNEYPWTVNPLDLADIGTEGLTREGLWKILSDNGTVQGIFTRINPDTGQLDYFINASMIGAGTVKAEYMEMYGLQVMNKKDGRTTIEITEDGNVNLNVESLVLHCGKTVEDYISETYMELSTNGLYIEVDSDGKQTIVNLAGDEVLMKSENIRLEGYTTINNGFSVDLEGNMTANNGNFSGNITGSTIEGGKIISPEIVSDDSSNPAFKLTSDGKLIAKDATIEATINSSRLVSPVIVSDESENPKFKLNSDGTLTALNAEIKGEISGTIITGETFKSSNNKFAILANGTLECEDANIKGNITAGSTITGSTINGGTIIGPTIKNAEVNPTFIVDSTGTVTGATIQGGSIGIGGTGYDAFTVDNNGNCNITKGTIKIGDNFGVTNEGNLTASNASITGNLNAGSTIKGSTIIGTSIQNAEINPSFTIDKDGNITGGSISIGENFSVTNAGNLTAKNASFTGNINAGSTITASVIKNTDGSFQIDKDGNIKGASITGSNITVGEGNIGGYKISDHTLTANNVGMSSSSEAGWAFWAGGNNSATAPFRVNHDGHLYADNATISGNVVSSTITGSTIQNSLENPSFSIDSNGNIKGGSININNNFIVDSNGNMITKNATIEGYITTTQLQESMGQVQLSFLETGGYNLIKNSSFNNSTDYWYPLRWDSSAGGHYINPYVRFASDPTETWVLSNRNALCSLVNQLDSSKNGMRLCAGFDSEPFSVRPFTEYTVSCLLATHRVQEAVIEMLCYDSNGTRLDDNHAWVGKCNIGGRDRDNWTKVTYSFTTQTNAATCHMRVFMNGYIHQSGQDSGVLWIAEPIVIEGNHPDIVWCASSDELYAGITSINKDGITVQMNEGADIQGYSRLSYDGLAIYNGDGSQVAHFGQGNTAFINELSTNRIHNRYVLQWASGEKGAPSNLYIAPSATGDGTGRDQWNRANSIANALNWYWNEYGCYIWQKDLHIWCNEGDYWGAYHYIGGWLGSGCIWVHLDQNARFRTSIVIEENVPAVFIVATKDPWEWNQSDACLYVQSGDGIRVRNSTVIIGSINMQQEGWWGNIGTWDDVGYDGSAITADKGSSVYVTNCDIWGFWNMGYASDMSKICFNNNRGHVHTECDVDSGSFIIRNACAPLWKDGAWCHNGGQVWGSYSRQENSWVGPKSEPPYVPPSEPEPEPPYVPPTENWQYCETTINASALWTVPEGSGSVTSGKSNMTGQGHWNSYKNHRGYATLSGVRDWYNDHSSRYHSAYLTIRRWSTSHGQHGAIPVPKFKKSDGSFWSCGQAFALGDTKTFQLDWGVIEAIMNDGRLEMFSTTQNDYSFYDYVSIKLTCEKNLI